jgi:hypothetical protein
MITREDNKLSYGTYRKPTATDTLIHNKSCHRNEHRLAGINCLTHRLRTYPITCEEKEDNIITQMLKANGYGDKILKKERHKNVENGIQKKKKKKKWAIFAYSGIEVRSITKIFTKHDIKTVLDQNTIGKLLKPTENKNKYEGRQKIRINMKVVEYIPLWSSG